MKELDTLSWVGRTRDAIDEQRLVLYAQPIIDTQSRKVVAHELLLRMVDRGGAIIPPGCFLPAAERFGLIEEIDRWVVDQATKLAARGLKVHFNISARSLGSRQLINRLKHALQASGAVPGLLVCEITETAVATDEAAAVAFVHELAGLGCEIALDDFGVGYGGFAYLKRLPITVLKIDIQFVLDLLTNAENQHVVKAIVTLAEGFGRKTIAEGVESQATLELLEAYGVDFAQGFAIGRPVPNQHRLRTLDVVHRRARIPSLTLGYVGDRGRRQHRPRGTRSVGEHAGRAGADRAVEQLDQLDHGDLGGIASEAVSALDAPLRAQHAGAAQGGEQLFQELDRDIAPARQLGNRHRSRITMPVQLHQRSQRIRRLGRDRDHPAPIVARSQRKCSLPPPTLAPRVFGLRQLHAVTRHPRHPRLDKHATGAERMRVAL